VIYLLSTTEDVVGSDHQQGRPTSEDAEDAGQQVMSRDQDYFFFFFFLKNTCSTLIRSSIAGVYRILCVSDSEHASRPLTCQSICRQHCTIYSFLFDLILKSSFVNWTVDISTVSILTSIITFKMVFIAAFSQWFKKNLWFKLIYIDYLEIFQFILSFYFLVLV
jgi:hypothetical protein